MNTLSSLRGQVTLDCSNSSKGLGGWSGRGGKRSGWEGVGVGVRDRGGVCTCNCF